MLHRPRMEEVLNSMSKMGKDKIFLLGYVRVDIHGDKRE
jgi:hypothetical protein